VGKLSWNFLLRQYIMLDRYKTIEQYPLLRVPFLILRGVRDAIICAAVLC
jgi:hypothetical protein